MTDEERDRMIQEMYEAFFEEPPTGGPPLIKKIGHVVDLYEKGSWGVKLLAWAIPALGAIAIGWDNLVNFLRSEG